ncbi:MAG: hypothetical protein AAGK22_24425 [Acidobacteriota bacterium]
MPQSDQYPSGLALRSLESEADYEQCLDLQRLTWGEDFRELVPPTIVRISQKVGGVAAGAFDDDDRMLGFVYGLTGLRHGRAANWSHMLAVRPEARGLGLGRDLKWFQREQLLELGVEVVYWTYDPLIARNANLNLNRLGALPVEYVIDMYGADTGSELHSGLGTDRFIVGWEIASNDVASRRGREATRLTPPPESEDVIVDGRSAHGLDRAHEGHRAWVEIPPDIDALKASAGDEAQSWRNGTQKALTALMESGFRVDGFSRSTNGYAYRLTRDS